MAEQFVPRSPNVRLDHPRPRPLGGLGTLAHQHPAWPMFKQAPDTMISYRPGCAKSLRIISMISSVNLQGVAVRPRLNTIRSA